MGAKPGQWGQELIWTEDTLHALGKEMVEFFTNTDNAFHMVSFAVHKKISSSCLKGVLRDYKGIMAHYHGQCLDILAQRLLQRDMEGNASKFIINTYLPRYLDDKEEAYKEIEATSYHKTKGETKGKIDAAGDGIDKLDQIKAAIQGELEDIKESYKSKDNK